MLYKMLLVDKIQTIWNLFLVLKTHREMYLITLEYKKKIYLFV